MVPKILQRSDQKHSKKAEGAPQESQEGPTGAPWDKKANQNVSIEPAGLIETSRRQKRATQMSPGTQKVTQSPLKRGGSCKQEPYQAQRTGCKWHLVASAPSLKTQATTCATIKGGPQRRTENKHMSKHQIWKTDFIHKGQRVRSQRYLSYGIRPPRPMNKNIYY